ncbi:MAG: membrane dipeptidase [Polyangiaceae bacterium]|jgi:membrane dipeptidase|nr:membrane dipeptidase [Polyangiaceae bacterium]MBK8942959.1 membrane dipeptidase [Polyangiaceae bacterium]
MLLEFVDHRRDPAAWAQSLDISREAIDLYLASDVLDLHVDSFIWTRVFGYDLTERHDRGLFNASFYSQVDFPRILEAQVTGATWVITTNPARVGPERRATFTENYARLREIFAGVSEQFAVVTSAAEYRAARAAGKHGAFIGVQGGNAFDATPEALASIPARSLLRVTVVHLTSSGLGATSSPMKLDKEAGLTDAGRAFVRGLNDKQIFVDLAHISRRGFWDAVEVADRSQPLLVTHTGVCGVHDHWRNLDDDQIKAIAKSGGTIGIMYEPTFLGDPKWGGRADRVVDHLLHVVKVAGEDFASLGSDWDGAIVTPRDMPTCLELPVLVDKMLKRGVKDQTIQKILGQNFLRVVEALRG